MKFFPYLSTVLGLSACTPEFNAEEWTAKYNRERAALYEQGPRSNLEQKLQGDLHFGIVLVDMQPRFLEHGFYPYESHEMITEQKRVLTAARDYDLPVLVFETDGYGDTIPALQDLIEQIPRTTTFGKRYDDGFEIYESIIQHPNPGIFPQDWLQEQGVNALYFMGINGNACVTETASSAQELNFTIATSNQVIATANDNAQSGDCRSESCDEAKAGLLLFQSKGILDPENQPFLDYFKEQKRTEIQDQ